MIGIMQSGRGTVQVSLQSLSEKTLKKLIEMSVIAGTDVLSE